MLILKQQMNNKKCAMQWAANILTDVGMRLIKDNCHCALIVSKSDYCWLMS